VINFATSRADYLDIWAKNYRLGESVLYPISGGDVRVNTPVQLQILPVILVVDDDEFVRKMLESMLTKRGYSVLTAADGKEGLKQFEDNSASVSLVITDVEMPEMTGPDMVKQLPSSVPIIFISGNYGNSLTISCSNWFVFVPKPIDSQKLLELIAGMVIH